MYDIELEKKLIIEKIKNNGLEDTLIDYNKLIQLYEPYKEQMSVKDFAQILGISDISYRRIKREGTRTRISIKNYGKLSEKRKKEIQEELINTGFANKTITYKEFIEIYKPYENELREREFAKLIGINYSNFYSLKNCNTGARILKTKAEDTIKSQIIDEIEKRGLINQFITYDQFLELYKPYEDKIEVKEFALILGISISNFSNMKFKNTKTRVLSKTLEVVTKERKEEIQNELINRGLANKSISYKEFLEIYMQYKEEMSEQLFATVLGISYASIGSIKYRGLKTAILITNNQVEERKEEIRNELINKGLADKIIGYNEFLIIYEPYKKEMNEQSFAEILNISYPNFKNMKKRKVKILHNRNKDITEERKKEIQQELMGKGLDKKSINYNEFLIIYEPYKEQLSEQAFAEILGVSNTGYMDFKYHTKQQNIKINFNKDMENRIQYQFCESKWYDFSYFESISKKYGISVEEVLNIIYDNKDISQLMRECLQKNGKIFIGDKKLDEYFLDKYIESISDIVHRYSLAVGRRLHTTRYSEDVAQNVLIRVIEKNGYITENLDNETAVEMIIRYCKVAVKYRHMDFVKFNKYISLDKEFTNSSSRNPHNLYSIISNRENIEENFLNKISEEIYINEKMSPIKVMQICLNNGMDRKESLNYTMQKFALTQEQLLEILTRYLEEKRKIKETEDGEKYLGEDK